MVRKVFLGLVILLALIQFFRPQKNENSEIITLDDISRSYTIPDTVHNILVKKCYDCHSNHTNYPWYFNLQPIAWWLNDHIREGKAELNFSEFSNYPERKAIHKLEEIGEVIHDGTMPLRSYTLLHPDAVITDEEREAINAWLATFNIVVKTQNKP
jgi:uncharacterized membrane protein